jgi:hypothetical protein
VEVVAVLCQLVANIGCAILEDEEHGGEVEEGQGATVLSEMEAVCSLLALGVG